MTKEILIREAKPEDWKQLAELRHLLWDDQSAEEHLAEMHRFAQPGKSGPYPAVNFLAVDPKNGAIVGFLEAGMRSHADGCDPAQPAGYIEGWFVLEPYRRRRVGLELMHAAEQWAGQQGCIELASDTWDDNSASEAAHIAAGFEVVDRCIHFRKPIR